jgi:hypothetical protein
MGCGLSSVGKPLFIIFFSYQTILFNFFMKVYFIWEKFFSFDYLSEVVGT